MHATSSATGLRSRGTSDINSCMSGDTVSAAVWHFPVCAAMVAEVRGVFGTLTYPHLIRPYLAYYGHLASHYRGPWCSPIAWWCDMGQSLVPEQPIYVKMVGLTVLSVPTMVIYYIKAAPYDFLNLYGACLQAPRTPNPSSR